MGLLALSLMIAGCEKEIDIELKESDPKVVIEGWVTDQPGPYPFKVTKTGAYLGDGAETMVSGAILVLSDDMGVADTLVETRPGWYESGHIQGIVEHTYTLDAMVDGVHYKATNYLPRINPILAVGYEYNDTMVFGAGYYVGLLALEPAGLGDYYQFKYWRNDTAFNSISDLIVTDDHLVDGQLSPFLYPYPNRLGDTVVVEVRTLSLQSYDFYLTVFSQGAGAGGPFASVPENLATNFDNGAFGWFGAAGVRRDTIVIQ